jgi:hypothetical protein
MAKVIRKIGIKTSLVLLGLFTLFALVYLARVHIDGVKSSMTQRYEAEINKLNADEVAKIQAVKWQVVDDLAQKCETKGIPEGRRNGVTVMDTNDRYSRGQWQFQTATVQYYYEKFYAKDITVDEAILIAHTEDKARQLAYDIIWEEVGGVWNWRNCADRLGLAQKIEIIRELEAK